MLNELINHIGRHAIIYIAVASFFAGVGSTLIMVALRGLIMLLK